MLQRRATSGPGASMYFFLWAALLSCNAVHSRSTEPISRTVSTTQQLINAVRDGVRDIEVRAHLDLRDSAQPDSVTDTLIVPAAVRTILVRSHHLLAVFARLCSRICVPVLALDRARSLQRPSARLLVTTDALRILAHSLSTSSIIFTCNLLPMVS